MIYLICGEDTFRANRKKEEIIERHRNIYKSGLNLKIFDLKEKKFENFKEDFQFLPMFSEKKLFIIKNVKNDSIFKEKFLKEIEKFAKSKEIIIFFEEGEVPKDKFFEILKRYGKVAEFKPLDEYKTKTWIKEEVKKYGTTIEPQALQLLVDLIGNNLWQLENEIKKIITYKERKLITFQDVKKLVSPQIELDIFKMIDSIALKNKKKSLYLLKRHLDKKEKISFIFSMIKFEFKNLLIVKDLIERNLPLYQIRKKINLHPFLLEKYATLARKFKNEELKGIYQKIFEVDLAIKTGKKDLETALTLFISQL